MTGAAFARQLLGHRRISGISVDRGTPNRYDWRERRIYLSPEIFDGQGITALAIAAHEVAHSFQHSQMGAGWLVLLSRLEPVNYWLERAAWNRARVLFRMELSPKQMERAQFDGVAASCLRVDARRAIRHLAGMVAVLALALLLRSHGIHGG